jgi:glucose-6-phosphate 1-dehydrogenase
MDVSEDRCMVERPAEGFGLLIFGASGDLAKRKLLPSLYRLFRKGMLPERFFILGAARSAFNDVSYREIISEVLSEEDARHVREFLRRIYYQPLAYDETGSFRKLKERAGGLHRSLRTGGRMLFYFAVPPLLAEDIVRSVGESGLARGKGWKRVVMEKPFGSDLQSARQLNRVLHRYFPEEAIFRIDHYLGKETVQDILLFRFANSIFEPIWNRNHIDHIQITAAETIGVGSRAGYYDRTGIVRDMFQNHLIQLLGIIALEPPSAFDSLRIREEKVKVFRALRRMSSFDVKDLAVFGQYRSGRMEGEKVPGYREERGIDPASTTPTFAAIRIFVDNWRWHGVPFYLRSGKRLKRRVTEVSIHFHDLPHSIFSHEIGEGIEPNVLVFRIQPDEAIELRFQSKLPGSRLCLREVKMSFSYTDEAAVDSLPDAYERVLLDCIRGDHLLFVGQEGVELAWEFFMPLLEYLEEGEGGRDVRLYSPGRWGPPAAERFMKRDGRVWWVR